MDFALMIEGQNGLTWPRWQAIGLAAEELGFAGIYRSDHFTNASPPDKASLELWTSLTWLASHTQRIEFGPMVSPVSFRHPVFTARMAKDVDDLSCGRLILGVGAGWQEREHATFHFDLLDLPARFDRFEEGLEVITRLLQSEEPVTYAGHYYALDEAILLPRPQRPGGPPILIGGNGPKRTLPLVARFAQEWNALFVSPQGFADLSAQLDHLLADAGRQPGDVRRSLMTGLVFGRTEDDLRSRLDGRNPAALRERGMVVGTPSQVAEQAAALAEAGVERLMLQWMDLDDLAGVAALAEAVL